MRAVIKEYTDLNPAIETYLIPNAKVLPQIEQPEEFCEYLKYFTRIRLICILPVQSKQIGNTVIVPHRYILQTFTVIFT